MPLTNTAIRNARPGEKAVKFFDAQARADRAANSFEAVAREWFAKYSPTWAASHTSKIIQRLEKDIFPWLGGKRGRSHLCSHCWDRCLLNEIQAIS